jgi:ribose transport system permease protein
MAQATAELATGAKRRVDWFELAEKYALVGVFVLLWLYFWLISSAGTTFASADQTKVVLVANAVKICLGIAFIVPLLAGQFDLSVGVNLAFASVIAAKLVEVHGWSMWLAAVIAVALSTFVGLMIGIFVTRFQVHSLIATLGVATVIEGVNQRLTEGRPIIVPETHALAWLRSWPWPVVYAAVIATVMWYVLEHTPIGRRLHAVGVNASAAHLSGIAVNRMIVTSFVVSGLLAGLAGVLQMTRSGGNPQTGPGFLLPVFAAAFLGSTVIKRTFNVLGTVIAVLGLAFTLSGLTLNGFKPYVESWFNGTALLAAVACTAMISRLRGSRAP